MYPTDVTSVGFKGEHNLVSATFRGFGQSRDGGLCCDLSVDFGL